MITLRLSLFKYSDIDVESVFHYITDRSSHAKSKHCIFFKKILMPLIYTLILNMLNKFDAVLAGASALSLPNEQQAPETPIFEPLHAHCSAQPQN